MGVGNRVCPRPEGAPHEVVAGFRDAAVATATVADAMHRFGALRGVGPVGGPGRYLAGPALTVRTRPCDNLMVHEALDLARPGDVLVVDAGGAGDHAIVGGLMCRYALRRGVAGVVVDGMVRDAEDLASLGVAVHAAGVVANGPDKDGPGEINVPVSCGGIAVQPGDVVVGDGDGVVVVPHDDAADVLAEAVALCDGEERAVDDIAEHRWDRAWVQRKLSESGCEHAARE